MLISCWRTTGFGWRMQLAPDQPIGTPPFGLSEDEIATVIDLTCQGAKAARAELVAGEWEVPITIKVRKAIRKVKKTLGLTNVEIRGEVEIDDMSTSDASIKGRIDISFKFARQFGDEDDYVAMECKRVGAGAAFSGLNASYVADGLVRFTNGQYATGHAVGFMLGYVLAGPVDAVTATIGTRAQKDFGAAAELKTLPGHADALAVLGNQVLQAPGNLPITMRHIFVDMSPAAPVTK